MSKVQPLGDRIVAIPQEASEKTSSGFYLPEDAKEKPKLAKVEAVGKDVKEVKKGDVVLHNEYTTFKIDGTEYVVAKEEDILAVVN